MPTSTHANSDRAGLAARGFTLIEVALVLLILAILLSFVAPRLLVMTEVRRDASARRLAAILGYLHDEASLRGRQYRLTIDLDRSSYEVRAVPLEGQGVDAEYDEDLSLARDGALPHDVRVESIETPTAFATSGRVDLIFRPESDGTSTRITLLDDAGQRSVLAFDGVTGRAVLLDRPSPSSVPP
jgi:prepilin-type N-terminal cleavage/methylation domain-containing protein